MSEDDRYLARPTDLATGPGDLGIVGQTIHELAVSAPVAALVQQYVSALMASGRGEEDYSALAKAVLAIVSRVSTLALLALVSCSGVVYMVLS